MSHAIFRVQGIKTTSDLRGIGKHNLDRVSLTNDDIDQSRSSENIQLVQSESYLKKFFDRIEPMKQEHDEKMKTERKDRVKAFEGKINSAKNDVACEFLFTSDAKFFEGKSKEEIQKWGQQSLDFVKNEIGIDEKNILHAVVHMDEKTPHLHVVAVPLVKKYDGRSKKDIWQLNRKHFIKTKEDMANLQDKYFEHMKNAGHDLQRGQKGSERHHLSVEEFKIEKVREEIEALQKDAVGLQKDVENLQIAVKGSKAVDEIKVEKAGLFDRGSVKLPVGDFEMLKTKAKATEAVERGKTALHLDVGLLKIQNDKLQKENVALQKRSRTIAEENSELIAENKKLTKTIEGYKTLVDHLQKTIEVVKNNTQKHLGVGLELMRSYVGESRLHVLFSKFEKLAFSKEVIEKWIPVNERAGAEKYMEKVNKREMENQEKESRKESEKPKKRTRDDFGMER